MTLPASVSKYLAAKAKEVNMTEPESTDDLFRSGILDSFSLIDLVTQLETSTGFEIPDSDVTQANFQSIAAIEQYLDLHNSKK